MAGKQATPKATARRSCGLSGQLQEALEKQSETMLEDRWEWAIPIHILKNRNIVRRGEPGLGGGNQCQSFCFSKRKDGLQGAIGWL